MESSFLTKEAAEKDRAWLVVDANDIPVGRLASEVASLLRGKHKPSFTPHVDCGDFVVVLNADKVKLTGKKLTDKKYYSHSGYVGGLKEISAGKLLEKSPEKLLQKAIKNMLPKSKLGRKQLGKLKVYAGSEHPHLAQKPENYQLKYCSQG